MSETYEGLEEVATEPADGTRLFTDTSTSAGTADQRYHYVGLVLGIVATVGTLSGADHPFSSSVATIPLTDYSSYSGAFNDGYVDVQQSSHSVDDGIAYRSAAEASAVAAVRELLESQARMRGVPTEGISVRRFSDHEHEVDEIVVTQFVGLGPEAALDYWDSVAVAIDGLIPALAGEQADIARRGLAVNIEWRPDAV